MKRSSRRIIVQNCGNSENEKIKSAEMSLSACKKDDQSMSVRVPGDVLVSPTVSQKRRSKHVQALYGKRKKVTLDQKALRPLVHNYSNPEHAIKAIRENRIKRYVIERCDRITRSTGLLVGSSDGGQWPWWYRVAYKILSEIYSLQYINDAYTHLQACMRSLENTTIVKSDWGVTNAQKYTKQDMKQLVLHCALYLNERLLFQSTLSRTEVQCMLLDGLKKVRWNNL